MAETRVINKFGNMTGWNSITVNLLGRDIEGITAINYNDTVTKENAYGAGKYPIGRSEQNYEAECSLTLYKEEMDGIRAVLPPGGRVQDIAPFDILVEYENKDGRITRDRIRNCEFTNAGVEIEQGNGSITVEHELIVSHIEWNVI